MLKLLTEFLGFAPEPRIYLSLSDKELLDIITEEAMNDEFNTPATREYDLRRANFNKIYAEAVKEGV